MDILYGDMGLYPGLRGISLKSKSEIKKRKVAGLKSLDYYSLYIKPVLNKSIPGFTRQSHLREIRGTVGHNRILTGLKPDI